MACECIAGLYKFSLNYLDCKSIQYTDLSLWMGDNGYATPSDYIVEITVPGYSTPVEVSVGTYGSTNITSATLGLPTECLPDGIYCFRVVNCDKIYTATKAMVCGLRCGLYRATEKAKTDKEWNVVHELEMLITSVELYAERGMTQSAQDAFDKAQRTLHNINCNCPC